MARAGSKRILLGALAWFLVLCVGLVSALDWVRSRAPHGRATGVLSNFRLSDQKDLPYTLYNDRAQAVVFISHSNATSFSPQSLHAVAVLHDRFRTKVSFYYINAQDDASDIARLAKQFQTTLPILIDDAQIVSKDLGFERTDEAVVVNPQGWSIVYRGAIEGPNGRADNTPLADAVANLLAGRKVVTQQTEAHGDPIRYLDAGDTSYEHVIAPLFIDRCVRCHQISNPAPLNSYDRVRKLAPMIRETLLTHRMPPWPLDPHFGKFKNDPSFTPRQVRSVVAWIDAGCPRDSSADPLAEVKPYQRAQDKKRPPDFLWHMPHPHVVPATGNEPYVYFQIVGPTTEDRWISEVAITPSNRNVVHHAFLKVLSRSLASYGKEIEKVHLDGESTWAPDAEVLTMIHPGQPLISRSPPGTAVPMPKGSYLAMEIHYTPTGRLESDRSTVAIWYYRGPKAPVALHRVNLRGPRRFVIPPGARDYVLQYSTKILRRMTLLAVCPHMHLRGMAMRATLKYPDGRSETMFNMPYYNFDWQRAYFFKEPLRLPAGTRISYEGVFDNSADNPNNPDPTKAVEKGLYTDTNEMFRLGLVYVEPDQRLGSARKMPPVGSQGMFSTLQRSR